MLVARLMKSGHGSSSSSSVSCMSGSRSIWELVPAISSVLCVSLLSAVPSLLEMRAVLSLLCRRLGVPMMSLSMRRCADWSLVTSCFVRVQDVHPYNIVGVTVPSKSRNLGCFACELMPQHMEFAPCLGYTVVYFGGVVVVKRELSA